MAERIRGPRAIVGIRRRTVDVATASWEVDWRRYFQGLERRYMAAFRKAAPGTFHVKQGPGSSWWSGEVAVMRELLNQQYAQMTETVWTDVVSAQVGRKIDFDLNARGVERILDKVGTRITAMADASQRAIASRVDAGIAAGASTDRIEAGVRDLLRGWGETGGRAHIIALTETGNAYNLAATEGYRESGLVDKVQVYDGPECGWTEHDDPDMADGSVRTLEEAEEYPLSHPHCQRAFAPVVLTEEEAQAADLQPGPSVEDKPLDFPDQYHYDEYADKAFADWMGSTQQEAVEAVETYTGGAYMEINEWLRGNMGPGDLSRFTPDGLDHVIGQIDKAMVPIPDTLTVTRAVYDSAYKSVLADVGFDSAIMAERMAHLAKVLPGRVLEEPGFFSTSMSLKPAFSNPVRIRMIVPKGTKAAPARQVSAFDYEKELLLHRGLRYVVTSAKWDGSFLDVEATAIR